MTAYIAPRITAGYQPHYLPWGVPCAQISIFSVAIAPAVNDTFQLVNIQANPSQNANGPSMTSVKLDITRIDTGTTAAFSVGDSGNAARYISSTVMGTTANGSVQGNNVAGSTGYQPFAASFGTNPTVSNQIYSVLVTCTVAPTTFQAATMTLLVDYTYDP